MCEFVMKPLGCGVCEGRHSGKEAASTAGRFGGPVSQKPRGVRLTATKIFFGGPRCMYVGFRDPAGAPHRGATQGFNICT